MNYEDIQRYCESFRMAWMRLRLSQFPELLQVSLRLRLADLTGCSHT